MSFLKVWEYLLKIFKTIFDALKCGVESQNGNFL